MAHETDILIKMDTTVAEFRRLAETDPIKAADSLEPELRDFEQWMRKRGMDLTRVERQILREYLGFKIVS